MSCSHRLGRDCLARPRGLSDEEGLWGAIGHTKSAREEVGLPCLNNLHKHTTRKVVNDAAFSSTQTPMHGHRELT